MTTKPTPAERAAMASDNETQRIDDPTTEDTKSDAATAAEAAPMSGELDDAEPFATQPLPATPPDDDPSLAATQVHDAVRPSDEAPSAVETAETTATDEAVGVAPTASAASDADASDVVDEVDAVDGTAADDADEADDATVPRPAILEDVAQHTPRKPTLAAAFTRQTAAGASNPPSNPPGGEARRVTTPLPENGGIKDETQDEIADEIEDEVDEWSLADQPTVYLPPRVARRPRPAPTSAPAPARGQTPPPARPLGPTARPQTPRQGVRIAAPRRDASPPPAARDSRSTPSPSRPNAPSTGLPRVAQPNARLERFQQLRQQRMAHATGQRAAEDAKPIADIARQWWHDLRPGLNHALTYQREARASGVHPIPAHAPETASRLGDAFGRLAASAREMTERAQAVAGPTLKRIHDRAEEAASAIVGRIEGSPTRQQAPLLGPGRIAVFFEDGVSIGQAQSLLIASRARPIRLIPRKHGFLALVPPGFEAETGKRLKDHVYVRDVAYLEYDEYGQPAEPH
jgi:hypothetical protein